MSRKLKLLNEVISNMLMTQFAHELKNYTLYKSFSNYFSIEGIPALEEYYEKRAQEELNHHNMIVAYLSEADCRVIYPEIMKNEKQEITSFIQPFIDTVDREIETTQLLYAIYEACIKEGDYMTAGWLLTGLIKEQVEEENTSRMAKVIMESDSDIYIKVDKILNLL